MLIGLNGLAGSGKDTLGEYLVSRHGFKRYAFGDKIRTALERLNPLVSSKPLGLAPLTEHLEQVGWDELKREEGVRGLLQRLGTELGRELIGADLWIHLVLQQMADDGVMDPSGNIVENVVITDVRFDNEAVSILERGGITVRVERDVERVNEHVSENGISADFISVIVYNDGSLEQLHNQADMLVRDYESHRFPETYMDEDDDGRKLYTMSICPSCGNAAKTRIRTEKGGAFSATCDACSYNIFARSMDELSERWNTVHFE